MASRRFGLYFAWSRPLEIGAELGVLENRFLTLFEFRRALWPAFEALRDPSRFTQTVQGFLDHIVLPDFERFRLFIREATGHDVPVIQREGDNPPTGHLDEELLRDIDMLIVVSLDHQRTSQIANSGEVELIRHFLSKQENCVVVCPHHDIGEVTHGTPFQQELKLQETEYRHHGDRMVPAQQKFSGFARSLLAGLGFPIVNQYGLNPGRLGDGSPAPLLASRDLDTLHLLDDVVTFNLHPHLPHLHIPTEILANVDLLACQPLNLAAPPHPFIEAGNRYFNAMIRLRSDSYPGTLLACDATLWSSKFGGLDSLQAFWRNLANLRL